MEKLFTLIFKLNNSANESQDINPFLYWLNTKLLKRKSAIIMFSVLSALFFMNTSLAAEDVYTLYLSVNEARTMRTQYDIIRVAVTSPDIANYVIIDKKELLINGKISGTTSMKIWTEKRRTDYLVMVSDQRLKQLEKIISNPKIKITFEGEDIILTGTVSSDTIRSRIHEQASAFINGKGKVNNLIRVSGFETIEKKIRYLAGNPDIKITRSENGLILSGRANSIDQKKNIEKMVKAWLPKSEKTNVANVMNVGYANRQVMIHLRVMEVAENSGLNFGVSWGSFQNSNPPVVQQGDEVLQDYYQVKGNFVEGLGSRFMPLLKSPAFTQVDPFIAQVNNLIDSGIIRILSEPKIAALCGSKSDVLIGGQVPIPIVTQDGVSINWKDYGIKLSLEPNIDSKNRVQAKIYAEVSSLDYSNAVNLSQYSVPGVKMTKAESKIHVDSGKTIFLSGLKREVYSNSITGIPVLYKIPLLGKLFSKTRTNKEKMELLISVTPYINSME